LKPSVAITTLGCKTNRFESAAMEEQLKKAGYPLIPFEDGADLVIVNSCTVTSATDAQTRNLIRRARRMNERARILVTGCYAQVDPSALLEIPGVSLILGNEEKRDFLARLESMEDIPRAEVSDIREVTSAEVLSLSSFEDRSRAFVQIQNGCDAFCSYCIIPYARGRSRSVGPDAVIGSIRALEQQGFSEVVLTGIHIGGFGADLAPRSSLLELVRRIEFETGVPRIRLGSIEPTELPDGLIEFIAASTRLCPHFHIPLQSGCDSVLERMNRHYDRAFFEERIGRIRKLLPEASIGLDLIVGFPGETDEEFDRTLEFVRSLPVSYLHVFPYSKRPGTPAAAMKEQIPGDVAKARAARMRELGMEKEAAYARGFLGRPLELVVEAGEQGGLRRGVSRNYLSVSFADEEVQPGRIARVVPEVFEEGSLRGRRL